MSSLHKLVDLDQPWLYASVGTILFNPIFWNLVARNEYRNKSMTKMFGGAYRGTCVLAFVIFTLGLFRDWVYHKALTSQPSHPILLLPIFKTLGYTLVASGQLFVLTSIYALGLTGTYLGDYFGILMSHRVTSFPFNVLRDPMYVGSTMCFLGMALVRGKPSGVALSAIVWVVYMVALAFEGPFTDKIYSSAAANKKRDASIATSTSTGNKVASAPVQAGSSGSASRATGKSNTADTSTSTYASALSHSQANNSETLPSTDPRPQVDLSHLGLGAPISQSGNALPGVGQEKAGVMDPAFSTASPGKGPGGRTVTRSRSRARIVDDD